MNRNKAKRKKGEFKMEAFEVIEKLESKGYKWQDYSAVFDLTVLSKRKNNSLTLQVEVDSQGFCNGLTLEDYLKEAKGRC
jgi:hypothetical protein